MAEESHFIACSKCFTDRGLRLDAQQIGVKAPSVCPNCETLKGKKLSLVMLEHLAYRFFVWGSVRRWRYGASPLIQFNDKRETSISVTHSLMADISLFERLLGVGFFRYEPRFWMIGETEPIKALKNHRSRNSLISKIIRAYPTFPVNAEDIFYRVRVNPSVPDEELQYDSPPQEFTGKGRLDSCDLPVLYASRDLQVCLHECRVTSEDDVYVATLVPNIQLNLLNLSVLLKEENVTEFESIDMAVHMLFLAKRHSYRITREIATTARAMGFHGLVYPSYFSLLRLGVMPFETVYGISHRRVPQYQDLEHAKAIPNIAIFGRPIKQNLVSVQCINRVILQRVSYDVCFGPATF